jgi:hypothetical protein
LGGEIIRCGPALSHDSKPSIRDAEEATTTPAQVTD